MGQFSSQACICINSPLPVRCLLPAVGQLPASDWQQGSDIPTSKIYHRSTEETREDGFSVEAETA